MLTSLCSPQSCVVCDVVIRDGFAEQGRSNRSLQFCTVWRIACKDTELRGKYIASAMWRVTETG